MPVRLHQKVNHYRRRLVLHSLAGAAGVAALGGALPVAATGFLPIATAGALMSFGFCGLILDAGFWRKWLVHTGQLPDSERRALEAPVSAQVETLRALADFAQSPNKPLAELAQMALEQFEELEFRLKAYNALLHRKFSPNELTFGRYLRAAQRVEEAFIRSSIQLTELLQSSAALFPKHLQNESSRRRKFAPWHKLESPLSERAEALDDTFGENIEAMRSIIAHGEKALRAFDKIHSRLAKLGAKSAAVALDDAIADIESLARQVEKYESAVAA